MSLKGAPDYLLDVKTDLEKFPNNDSANDSLAHALLLLGGFWSLLATLDCDSHSQGSISQIFNQ